MKSSMYAARRSSTSVGLTAQDVLHVCGALSAEDNASREALLDRHAALLIKRDQRDYVDFEEQAGYPSGVDSDTDSDPDPE